MKMNCWEAKKCGRQAGGTKTGELGVCPAATDAGHNGINGGKNAGRHCWKVAGTLCGGNVQGTYAQKLVNCVVCEFFKQVKVEEAQSFKP